MRIAIITLPLHTNYGGILQAYALQTVLERMGHEVTEIKIEEEKRRPGFIGIVRHLLSPIKQNVLKVYHRFTIPEYKRRTPGMYTSKFIKRHIHQTVYRSYNEIPVERYDAIVVGSDQVWRNIFWTKSTQRPIDFAFLSFMKDADIKRVAYAASFGVDTWQWDEATTENLRTLAQKFNAISVREASGVGLCKEHLGVEAVHVPDPTLLLDKEDYMELVDKDEPRHPDCCLSYILDSTDGKTKVLNGIADALKLDVHYANSRNLENKDLPDYEKVQPPVESWLQGFHDAAFVVTDSFHACVFSIIFNKPFIVIGNEMRGNARFLSLLDATGQRFRLISNPETFSLSEKYLCPPNCNLNKLRQGSISFLKSYLGEL